MCENNFELRLVFNIKNIGAEFYSIFGWIDPMHMFSVTEAPSTGYCGTFSKPFYKVDKRANWTQR